jgi:hypothetical protein
MREIIKSAFMILSTGNTQNLWVMISPWREHTMKETIKTHPKNLEAKTNIILSPPVAEQETMAAKSQQNSPPLQKKVDYPAGCLAEKRKKRRIPFVALALVLV